ncbi:hypothetical protein C2S51_008229 [Perilla frutescens var. frutescens]|nr:hypothetical protein C2S51_008229 [Perilla frutescens var. frutescens]
MEETPSSGVSILREGSRSNTQVILLQGQLISIKLDDTNYLLWKQQVMAVIEGFGLEKFLVGEESPPKKFIPGTSSDDVIENPEYVSWCKQDRLIVSWLLSSTSESVLVGRVGLTRAREIWETIESNYANQSKAKLMQLKFQLQTLKKGNMSMKDYLNKVKQCCDVLGTAGDRPLQVNKADDIKMLAEVEVMVSIVEETTTDAFKEVEEADLMGIISLVVKSAILLDTQQTNAMSVQT